MKSEQNKSAKVKVMLDKGKSVTDIAKAVPCHKALVYMVRKEHFPELGRKYAKRKKPLSKRQKLMKALKLTPNTTLDEIRGRLPVKMASVADRGDNRKVVDMVSPPAQYTVGGIEVADFIKAKNLSYGRGNVVKYVTRAGVRDKELEDLEKAAWYLASEIATLKGIK